MLKIVSRKTVAVYFQVKITRSGIETSLGVRKCVLFACLWASGIFFFVWKLRCKSFHRTTYCRQRAI